MLAFFCVLIKIPKVTRVLFTEKYGSDCPVPETFANLKREFTSLD